MYPGLGEWGLKPNELAILSVGAVFSINLPKNREIGMTICHARFSENRRGMKYLIC